MRSNKKGHSDIEFLPGGTCGVRWWRLLLNILNEDILDSTRDCAGFQCPKCPASARTQGIDDDSPY